MLETDRHKLFEVLVNLLSNACHAVQDRSSGARIIVRGGAGADGTIAISVEDNGVGIAPDLVDQVFNHGFTTKQNGHGFGLHASACAALELGGSLRAVSAGCDDGATFTLVIPRVHPSTAQVRGRS